MDPGPKASLNVSTFLIPINSNAKRDQRKNGTAYGKWIWIKQVKKGRYVLHNIREQDKAAGTEMAVQESNRCYQKTEDEPFDVPGSDLLQENLRKGVGKTVSNKSTSPSAIN